MTYLLSVELGMQLYRGSCPEGCQEGNHDPVEVVEW
jgi:hypothetical protein